MNTRSTKSEQGRKTPTTNRKEEHEEQTPRAPKACRDEELLKVSREEEHQEH
jgi:hypothetical protein